MINVVVDLGGADKDSTELISGAIEAINKEPDLHVYVACKEDTVINKLKTLDYNQNQLDIINSDDVVTNYDSPTRAFKEHPESSLIKGILKAKELNCPFVSCGSTGAVLVSASLLLGHIKGIRPALASLLPTQNGNICVLDCGANVDTKSSMLVDFALMGISYQEALGIKNPRVGLLSNGSEDKKGNELVKETHLLLKSLPINFVGNVEGNQVLSDKADVLVCDGFDGNVLIKTIEGTVKTVIRDLLNLKDSLNESIVNNQVKSLMARYDYNSKGGAVLLGVNNVIVKGHGGASSETIKSISLMAYNLEKNKLIQNILETFKKEERL